MNDYNDFNNMNNMNGSLMHYHNNDGSMNFLNLIKPLYDDILQNAYIDDNHEAKPAYTISSTYAKIQMELISGSMRIWFSSKPPVATFQEMYNNDFNNVINHTNNTINRSAYDNKLHVISEYIQYDNSCFIYDLDSPVTHSDVPNQYFNLPVIRNDDYIDNDDNSINIRMNELKNWWVQILLYDRVIIMFNAVNNGEIIPSNNNGSITFIDGNTGLPNNLYPVLSLKEYQQYEMIYKTYKQQIHTDYKPIWYYDM